MTILDAHTHPHFREHQSGREAADVFLREAQRHGIEHVVALGDVLASGGTECGSTALDQR
jgi:Tat protein secretion system quality control protein TatD with DNase activity